MSLTTNKNLLSPLGVRFVLNRLPNVEYFCQTANLPGITINEVPQTNPFVTIPRPGDKVTYEPLNIRFKVDENMENYIEIHNWIIGLGHPQNFDQYKNLKDNDLVFSDASIVILSSNNNPSIRVSFKDLFPLSLSSLLFDVTQTEIQYLEADANFRYAYFDIETL